MDHLTRFSRELLNFRLDQVICFLSITTPRPEREKAESNMITPVLPDNVSLVLQSLEIAMCRTFRDVKFPCELTQCQALTRFQCLKDSKGVLHSSNRFRTI
jgi:hypothetical protein